MRRSACLGCSPRSRATGSLVLLTLLGGCAEQRPQPLATRTGRLAPESAAATVVPSVLAALRAPRSLALDALARSGMPPGVLPKFRTAAEKAARRRRQQGLVPFDQFDNFRKQYVGYYYPTAAPVGPARVVAEYEDSQAWLVTWPFSQGADGDKFLSDVIVAGWGTAPLLLTYSDANHRTWLEQQLTAAGLDPKDSAKVTFFGTPADSIWARDFGPLSLQSTGAQPTLSFVDFRYYHERVLDDQIPTALAKSWGVNVFRPDFEIEGGNFMTTAEGLCASSKGALWYNPQLTQSAIEQLYKDYLGCKQTLFPTPLEGEDTSHLDMFSKFSDDTHVLVGEYTATQDARNKPILDANAALFAVATPGGATMQVIRIPMPKNANNIWRTYTNSLSLKRGAGKVVIIPVFSDEQTNEAAALAAYAQAYPGWTLETIDSKAVIPWGGAVHCTTMQIGEGTHLKMEADPKDLCGAGSLSCSGGAGGCGNITDVGCCDGNIVKYCDQNGELGQQDCASSPSCGWSGKDSWYDCGNSPAEDPTGKQPRSCNVVADGGPPPVLDGGGPVAPDAGAGCGGLAYEGCCDGDTLQYCADGTRQAGACAPGTCGWRAADGYYDCDTDGKAEATGQFPRACPEPGPDAAPPPADSGAGQDAARSDAGTKGGGGGCAVAAARPVDGLWLLWLLCLPGLALSRRRAS